MSSSYKRETKDRTLSEGEYSNSEPDTPQAEYSRKKSAEKKTEERSGRSRERSYDRHRRSSRDRSHKRRKGSRKRKHRRKYSSSEDDFSSSSSDSRSRRNRHSKSRSSRRRRKSRSKSRDGRNWAENEQYDNYQEREETRSNSYKGAPPNATIMIRALANFMTEQIIRDDIKSFGFFPSDIRLIRDRVTGAPRGFAFVDFSNVAEAEQYMSYKDGLLTINGKCEGVLQYSVGNERERNEAQQVQGDWICYNCSGLNFKKRQICYKCSASKDDDSKLWEESGMNPTCTIVLRDLDVLSNEDSVSQALEHRRSYDLGNIPITNIMISRELDTKLSRGICFLGTGTVSDAVRLFDCLTNNPLEVDERFVTSTYFKAPKEKSSLNSAAAAALAAAQWSSSATAIPTTVVKQNNDAEIERLAEQSAALYAKTPIEKATYLVYYRDYYKKQLNEASPSAVSLSNTTAFSAIASSSAPSNHEQQDNTTVPTTSSNYAQECNREKSPDMARLVYDESSCYYYDPLTFLYYDSTSQYFYDSFKNEYLIWNAKKHRYDEVKSSSGGNKEKSSDKSEKSGKVKPLKKSLQESLKKVNLFNDKLGSVSSVAPSSDYESISSSSCVTLSYSNHPDTEVPPTIIDPDETEARIEKSLEQNPFMDIDKIACTLCKRQFSSIEILQKHCDKSELHKKNLEALIPTTSSSSPTSNYAGSSSKQYRDRASERRKHFGIDALEPKNSLKEMYIHAKAVKEEIAPVYENPNKDGIKSDNIGNRMLQKMGWQEGEGLGRNKTGRTDIIHVEHRTEKAGLGVRIIEPLPMDLNLSDRNRYSRTKEMTIARFRNLEDPK